MATEPLSGASSLQENQGLHLRQSVRKIREGKEFAKAFDVRMSGTMGHHLENIVDSANFILSGLEEENQYYIDRKYREVESYIGISYEELRERHSEGFRKCLKQQYRLFRKEQPADIKLLENDAYIKDLATGYSFDFIRTLTLAKKMGVAPSIALDLAELTHWNNPDILLFLAQKFPDVDSGLINQAAVNNPTDPEGFIQRVLDLIPVLQAKFPDVDAGLIRYAVSNNSKDPEGFIQRVLDLIPLLQAKFPNEKLGIITRAAINNPKDPEGFIQRVLDSIPVLQAKFPNEKLGIITRAAINNPTDPEGFIQRVLDSIPRLKAKFPNDPSLVKWAAVHHAHPEGFIQRVLDLIPVLQAKFPNADLGFVKFAATHHVTDPEGFIGDYYNRLKQLKENHKKENIFPWLLNQAAYYIDAEKALKRMMQGEELDEKPNQIFAESDI